VEFHFAIRKTETTWFKGKWMELEDKMLSQVEKDEGHIFSLIHRG
jgi:hypothetical protein